MKESSKPVNQKVTSIKDEKCKRIQSDVEIIDFIEKTDGEITQFVVQGIENENKPKFQ